MSPAPATAEPMAVDDSASKKAKRKQLKAAAAVAAEAEAAEAASAKKKEKKEKKRKAKEPSPPAPSSDEEEKSSTSSEETAPAAKKVKKEKTKKNVEASEDDGEITASSDEDPADPNALTNFRISEQLRQRLKSKGIKALFPIQATTFDLVLDGSDLVGRARTGQGKTLAFVLPILESLVNGTHKASRKTDYGRPPSVLVLLPTRELANQVHADFEFYGAAYGLSACCVYGGSPYRPQEMALRKGVDIVVGTPGRIKDFIVKGTLNLKCLKFRVLDEADEMLNMGFVDDVELILGKVEDVTKVQTLLFSATLPDWVNKLSMRFLKGDRKTVDLVGNEKLKASASVKHLALPCNKAARAQVIPDIIRCYSHGGRTIIFADTKDSTSELSGLIPGSRALHGDVVQAQREVILAGFRGGKFQVLVATNVAARGLDINDVELVIQCEPPRDVEAYIHRSGRTGRAGNTGVAVMLYEPRYKHSVSRLERESGVKFEHISAPQPTDVAESAGTEAADAIASVSDSVIPVFRQQAEQLLSSSGLSAADLLAKALAKAVGYTDIKKRSLLSSMEDYTTLHLQTGRPMWSSGFAFTILKRFMPEEKLADVKGATLTADGTGVVFDVPAADVEDYIQAAESAAQVTIDEVKQLPPLQEREQSSGGKDRVFSPSRGCSMANSESSSSPLLRPVPGSYGLPVLGAIRDRLDFFYFQGQDKYFESRIERNGSTVVRINVPPGPFMARDPRVVALLDAKSFPVLFDLTKVEKKNVVTGTFMPPAALTGGYRICSYLDPSEPTHAKVRKLLFSILHSRNDAIIPTFRSNFSELFTTIESQLAQGGKAEFNKPNELTSFDFIGEAYFGVRPSATDLGAAGPTKAAKWILFLLHPIVTLGLPMFVEDPLLHTFHLPPFLVSGDYKALYKYFSTAASQALDTAESLGLSRDEACHNLLFATILNSYGGLKVLFPGILANVAKAGAKLHERLVAEIRAAVAEAGGKVTLAALEKMELVKSVVWESLRLDPPVKFQYGHAKADLQIESHDAVFQVKKGEMLFGYQPCATKDARVFGPTAREFVGDRFVGEEGRKLLQYVYWSNGRETESPGVDDKQCPGKDFVLIVGRLFLAELFLRYDTFTADVGKELLGVKVVFTGVKKATSGPATE